MSTLTYQLKHDSLSDEELEQLRDDVFDVPGVTGAGFDNRGTFFVLVEDDSELDRDELGRFFGFADYADFLEKSTPTIINETELLEQQTAKYEVGRITSLVDITPDEDD